MAKKKSALSMRSGARSGRITAARTAVGKAVRQVGATQRSRATDRATEPGARFCRAVDAALRQGKPQAISDEALRRVLTAAVKAYAAKAEDAEREFAPFLDGAVTATETVIATCAMIRAAGLNLFDVAMWFRRPVAGEF